MLQNHLNKTNDQTIFSLEDVSIRYEDIFALDGINLNIYQGEILFITGASGAGKTSLLKLLAGSIRPTKGRVLFPNNFLKNKKFFSVQVFQDLRLMDTQTGEQNLFQSFDRKIYDSKNSFVSEMKELCRAFGIIDRIHLRVIDANGGLKQKIAMIRALLSRPDCLIADEPTCSLDYDNNRKVFDILSLYNLKKNLTVIWSSHNKEIVRKFSGRIIHLDNGKLVYTGHACFI
jgi:cell division transport system ATP-binding protein